MADRWSAQKSGGNLRNGQEWLPHNPLGGGFVLGRSGSMRVGRTEVTELFEMFEMRTALLAGRARDKGMEGMSNKWDETRLRKVVTWVTLVVTTLFVLLVWGVVFYLGLTSPDWQPFVKDHFRALFGVPAAVGSALVLVIILRAAAGPIEFETPFGFKFRGASGPLVLWMLCFLAIAAAFWQLW